MHIVLASIQFIQAAAFLVWSIDNLATRKYRDAADSLIALALALVTALALLGVL